MHPETNDMFQDPTFRSVVALFGCVCAVVLILTIRGIWLNCRAAVSGWWAAYRTAKATKHTRAISRYRETWSNWS